MTAVSAPPPAPTPVAAEALAPKRGGVDYSKFDSIVDSDDEKPQQQSSAPAKAARAEPPHCHNCHKEISKPLRCGICKKVSYCSTQCQKDDWSFHKRNCKKPEEPKKSDSAEPRREQKSEARKPKEEEKVVEDEENISWYRHREWKPTSEPKKEFAPTPISEDARSLASAQSTPTVGSVWNAAGTWEEKDVTAMAHKTLRERLQGLPDVDVAGGALVVESVSEVDGDASKPVIRGKMRHIFDLSFKLEVAFKWMGSSGQQKASGTVSIHDFTNDTFIEDGPVPPTVLVDFKATELEAARRKAVEASIGARGWPPQAGSLMAAASERLRAWAREYQEQDRQ